MLGSASKLGSLAGPGARGSKRKEASSEVSFWKLLFWLSSMLASSTTMELRFSFSETNCSLEQPQFIVGKLRRATCEAAAPLGEDGVTHVSCLMPVGA